MTGTGKTVAGVPELTAAVLTEGEVEGLIACLSASTAAGLRNRALLATLYWGMLRLSEALDLAAAEADGRRGVLRVGGRSRPVQLDGPAVRHLRSWLRRRATSGLPPGGPLFGTRDGARLDPGYVRALLGRLARGGTGKPLSAERLRAARAAVLHADGVPVALIQERLGHAAPATTARYLARLAPSRTPGGPGDDAVAAAARLRAAALGGSAPWAVLGLLAQEAGELVDADLVLVMGLAGDGTARAAGGWSRRADKAASTMAARHGVVAPDGDTPISGVLRLGRPQRMDDLAPLRAPEAGTLRALGYRGALAVPLPADGPAWGVLAAATRRAVPMRPGAEADLLALVAGLGVVLAGVAVAGAAGAAPGGPPGPPAGPEPARPAGRHASGPPAVPQTTSRRPVAP